MSVLKKLLVRAGQVCCKDIVIVKHVRILKSNIVIAVASSQAMLSVQQLNYYPWKDGYMKKQPRIFVKKNYMEMPSASCKINSNYTGCIL